MSTTTDILKMPRDAERAARLASRCPGCGGPKDLGCIVCWTCFKYRPDNPYKYATHCDLERWLREIGRPSLAEQGIEEPKP